MYDMVRREEVSVRRRLNIVAKSSLEIQLRFMKKIKIIKGEYRIGL